MSKEIKPGLFLSSKNDILGPKWEDVYKKIVEKELEVAVQNQLDPKEVSAKKPLKFSPGGQPISYEEITRGEYVGLLKDELEKLYLILKTIESQFE